MHDRGAQGNLLQLGSVRPAGRPKRRRRGTGSTEARPGLRIAIFGRRPSARQNATTGTPLRQPPAPRRDLRSTPLSKLILQQIEPAERLWLWVPSCKIVDECCMRVPKV